MLFFRIKQFNSLLLNSRPSYKVNSAFHPYGVGKSSSDLSGLGCVHLSSSSSSCCPGYVEACCDSRMHDLQYCLSAASTTGCLPVSERVKSFRLRFFGHLAWSNPEEDHHCVIAAALRPPSDWRRPAGRPRTTWLRTIWEDLQSQNVGVHTAWRKAKERDTWHQVVSTATLC